MVSNLPKEYLEPKAVIIFELQQENLYIMDYGPIIPEKYNATLSSQAKCIFGQCYQNEQFSSN